MDEEARWIELSRGGSAEAFSELVILHQARVRGYVGRYVREKDLVDDLAQEVFLSAYRRLDTFRGESPLSLWLLGIARTTILSFLRSAGRRHSRVALAERRLRYLEADLESLEDRERELAALAGCLEHLPENSARLIREFYFESRSSVEIAAASGHRESAVRMTLFRVRKALRGCIQQKLAVQGEA